MANTVTFQMYSGAPVIITGDDPLRIEELTESTVKSITVGKDPWVFFELPCYGGDFVIYREGKNRPFPSAFTGKVIRSVRVIKGGVGSSQVTLYPQPFFSGKGEPFQRGTPQLQDKYFSLRVDQGGVIFFDEENYEGGKRILLKGDEVQNFNAVKLTSIGRSMKTAEEMVQ